MHICLLLVLPYIVQIWIWFLCVWGLFCSVMHNIVQKPQHHVAPGVDLYSYQELITEVKLG